MTVDTDALRHELPDRYPATDVKGSLTPAYQRKRQFPPRPQRFLRVGESQRISALTYR